jgi:sugar phosphate isomerase/epimerase
MLRLGYNTVGFSHHEDVTNVIGIIHNLGYVGMELTLDWRHFHPYSSDLTARQKLSQYIELSGLELVLNTGGRYVLSDAAHEPSLVSATENERSQFVQFVKDTIHLAPTLGARIIMLHSGSLSTRVDPSHAWEWLTVEVAYLAEIAEEQNVLLAFEFHPAMFVATLADYYKLKERVSSSSLKLTLDVGHVACTETRPLSEVIEECNGEVVNVHLEDIKGRKHVHLPIGQGDIDFEDVFNGLKAIGYSGLINAEFNSNDLEVDECQLARETFKHLRTLM